MVQNLSRSSGSIFLEPPPVVFPRQCKHAPLTPTLLRKGFESESWKNLNPKQTPRFPRSQTHTSVQVETRTAAKSHTPRSYHPNLENPYKLWPQRYQWSVLFSTWTIISTSTLLPEELLDSAGRLVARNRIRELCWVEMTVCETSTGFHCGMLWVKLGPPPCIRWSGFNTGFNV